MASDRNPGVIGDLIVTDHYPKALKPPYTTTVITRKSKKKEYGIIIRRHRNGNWIIFWPSYKLMTDLPPCMYELIYERRKENSDNKVSQ